MFHFFLTVGNDVAALCRSSFLEYIVNSKGIEHPFILAMGPTQSPVK
jgi:hypothetical protein